MKYTTSNAKMMSRVIAVARNTIIEVVVTFNSKSKSMLRLNLSKAQSEGECLED